MTTNQVKQSAKITDTISQNQKQSLQKREIPTL